MVRNERHGNSQMNDPEFKILDQIHRTALDTSTRIASVEATLAQFQITVTRFYDKDLGPLIQAVTSNQKAIAQIQIELAVLKTRVAVWGSIGVMVSSVLVHFVTSRLNL